MQSAFHGLLVKKLLSGGIDTEQWSLKSKHFTSIVVKAGIELGEICMNDDPEEAKTPRHLKLFFGVQAELSRAWKESIKP
jgi:hypothetical protein